MFGGLLTSVLTYAAALANNSWDDCVPVRLDLKSFMERWIPGLIHDNRRLVVFPTANNEGGVIKPEALKKDLLQELQQYE